VAILMLSLVTILMLSFGGIRITTGPVTGQVGR
jgi:hypothetical protein